MSIHEGASFIIEFDTPAQRDEVLWAFTFAWELADAFASGAPVPAIAFDGPDAQAAAEAAVACSGFQEELAECGGYELGDLTPARRALAGVVLRIVLALRDQGLDYLDGCWEAHGERAAWFGDHEGDLQPAVFVEAFSRLVPHLGLPSIGFTWGVWCTRGRPGGFGGGACVVERDGRVQYLEARQWLAETLAAAQPVGGAVA